MHLIPGREELRCPLINLSNREREREREHSREIIYRALHLRSDRKPPPMTAHPTEDLGLFGYLFYLFPAFSYVVVTVCLPVDSSLSPALDLLPPPLPLLASASQRRRLPFWL